MRATNDRLAEKYIVVVARELGKALKTHLDAYKGDVVETIEGDRVVGLEKSGDGFKATTKSGKTIESRAVLIASGAGRRKLS